MTREQGIVPKGWGHEEIWATNDHYCGKLLSFRKGSECSMHFHLVKHETWRVMSGVFVVRWIDTHSAITHEHALRQGDTWTNTPGMPHQLTCLESGVILEVSTPDSVEDNYRIAPGDSQR